MRLAALALILLTTPAAAGDTSLRPTAEYVAAYAKARAFALAHMEQDRQPSCRRAIGARAADLVLDACFEVVGGSTRNYCTPANSCAQILDKLDWCSEWKGGVPCVPVADGGEDRRGQDRGDWWTRAP